MTEENKQASTPATAARKVARRKTSRKGKQLNEAEKVEAIELWKAGSTTLDELAEKFDRSRLTFLRLFNAEGVAKGESKGNYEKKIKEAVEAASVGDIELIATRAKETKDEHYKMASGLSKLAWSLIVEAKRENRKFNLIAGDLKALKYAADVMKTTREERYAVLGLNEKESKDDDDIGDLVVREITEEEIKEQAKNHVGDDDLGVDDMEDVMVDID